MTGEELEALILLMRKHGVAKLGYNGAHIELGPAPLAPLPLDEPAEQEIRRRDDGLTEEEARLLYASG
jgi:hypothetical protein